MAQFSFCEAATAGSASRWHIRQLTKMGQKFSGGVDTPALCGRQVSWDIKNSVTLDNPVLEGGVCLTCKEIYKDKMLP